MPIVRLSTPLLYSVGLYIGFGRVVRERGFDRDTAMLYMLPVSLFGMSVSAAELPVMSSALGTEEQIGAALRKRLDSGLRHIAFFVVPSAAAFLGFGIAVLLGWIPVNGQRAA